MTISKKVFVALDSNNFEEINKLVDTIKNYIFGVKIGYEFFFNFGLKGYKKIQNKNGNRDMNYSYTHYGNLQRRCQTYKQNAFNFDISNNILFKSCCVKDCAGGHAPIATYKYSNVTFNSNGAVSNRARIHRLKNQHVSSNTSYREFFRTPAPPRINIYTAKSKNKCFCNSRAHYGGPASKTFHN